jgi:hypothetical protein
MRPTIYEYKNPESGEVSGFLVDQHSAFSFKDENGEPRTYYANAVQIGEITTRYVRVSDDGDLIHPHPCLFRMHKKMLERPIKDRGIHPKAAEALLHLASAFTNTQVDFARTQITIGDPATRGVIAGWDVFKFLAAWKWSYWQSQWMKGDQRHRDMKVWGYPGSAGSLRVLLHDLGLVTTKKSER